MAEVAGTRIRSDIEARLATIKCRIEATSGEAGRACGSVRLLAVTKVQPQEAAQAALEAGHRLFGENRVQEAKAKWPILRDAYPDFELHLIGPLQTNKVKDAVALFDAIETVDRPKLARALASEMARSGRYLNCYIEVNIAAELQKSGVVPENVDAFVAFCRDELGLRVEGLMCIPPIDADPALHFAHLAEIASRNGLARLSMGMTADFEAAIRAGATEVRVGTAIFGPRLSPPTS